MNIIWYVHNMSYHSLFSEVLEIIGQIQTLYAAVLCNELHAQVLKGIVECLVLCIATSCVFLFLYYEYIYIYYTPWICAYVSKTLYYIYFWQLDFPLVHVSCYLIFKSGKKQFFFTKGQLFFTSSKSLEDLQNIQQNPTHRRQPPHYRDPEKSNLSANDDSPVKSPHRFTDASVKGWDGQKMCSSPRNSEMLQFSRFYQQKRVPFFKPF